MDVKVDDECIPCILRRTDSILSRAGVHQPELIRNKIESQLVTLQIGDSWLTASLSPRLCPAQYGSTRQQVLEDYNLGNTYQREKNIGQNIGKAFFDTIKLSDLTLEEAIIISVLGNGLEFDTQGEYVEIQLEDFRNELSKVSSDQKLRDQAMDTSKYLHEMAPGKIVHLFDNCGEEYFDFPMLLKLRELGWSITGITKGKPVLNDLCSEDISYMPDGIEILDTGSSDVGVFLGRIPKNTLDRIIHADLLISKGMANFETLSSESLESSSLFLLRAKCEPVAKATKSNFWDYVILYQEANRPFIS